MTDKEVEQCLGFVASIICYLGSLSEYVAKVVQEGDEGADWDHIGHEVAPSQAQVSHVM